MRVVLKSFGLAIAGAAIFFSFFMMFSIPVLSILARARDNSTPDAPNIILAPMTLFRYVGLPLAAVAFVICFVLAMKKYGRPAAQS